jgi:DNA-directed RNA polymerase subunit beta
LDDQDDYEEDDDLKLDYDELELDDFGDELELEDFNDEH